MTDYLVQEDGTSKFLLEDGSGALLLETSGPTPISSSDTATLSDVASVVADLSGISDSATLGDNPVGQITVGNTAQTLETAPTGGTSFTVNLPSGYIAGDLVVIQINAECASIADVNASHTGWTQLSRARADQYNGIVMYRIMNGTEGSTVTFTLSQTCNTAAAGAVAYRGVDPVNPIDGTALTGTTTASNTGFTTSTQTTGHPNEIAVLAVLAFGGLAPSGTSSTPAGATMEVFFNFSGSAHSVGIADVQVPASGTGVSFTISYTSSSTTSGRSSCSSRPSLPLQQ